MQILQLKAVGEDSGAWQDSKLDSVLYQQKYSFLK